MESGESRPHPRPPPPGPGAPCPAHPGCSRGPRPRSGPRSRTPSGRTGRATAGSSPPGSAALRRCPRSSPALLRSRYWARSSGLCPRGRRGGTAGTGGVSGSRGGAGDSLGGPCEAGRGAPGKDAGVRGPEFGRDRGAAGALGRRLGLDRGQGRGVKIRSAPGVLRRGRSGARPCGCGSLPPRSAAGPGLGTHLAHVEVRRGPLASQGAVLDVAGGGQRQEAEQTASEAGAGHGAGALGPGSVTGGGLSGLAFLCLGIASVELCLRGW